MMSKLNPHAVSFHPTFVSWTPPVSATPPTSDATAGVSGDEQPQFHHAQKNRPKNKQKVFASYTPQVNPIIAPNARDGDAGNATPAPLQTAARRPVAKPAQIKLTRQQEIEIIAKRYADTTNVLQNDDHGSRIAVSLLPSDPEWSNKGIPISQLDIIVDVPPAYPSRDVSISFAVCNDSMPDPVRERCESLIGIVNALLRSYLSEEHSKTLLASNDCMLRELFSWIVKNMEHLMVDPKRDRSGIKFMKLPKPPVVTDTVSPDVEQVDEPQDDDNDSYSESESESESDDEPEPAAAGPERKLSQNAFKISCKGVVLHQTVSLMRLSSVAMMLTCKKCDNLLDVSVPAFEEINLGCSKCGCMVTVFLSPEYLHAGNFENAGTVELYGASYRDIGLCDYEAGCAKCSKTKIFKAVVRGTEHSAKCSKCFEKITISALTGISLIQSLVSKGDVAPSIAARIASVKKTVKPKAQNLNLRIGDPLPENGTCKHYRKSYRWFRFSCCGIAYPCDVCHDEQSDHTSDMAHRMICGFCSTEQTSANKSCAHCGKDPKGKSGNKRFWEGGKGCRDGSRMSRNDSHKHRSKPKPQ